MQVKKRFNAKAAGTQRSKGARKQKSKRAREEKGYLQIRQILQRWGKQI